MSAKRLFGTDGVRGVANCEPMTVETVVRLGRSFAALCARSGRGAVVAVGRDTRLSGPMLESALAAGITSAGGEVMLAGEIPTPAVALLSRGVANAGAVVSASHNPYADNGVKFFGGNGFKLPDESEREIETMMACLDAPAPLSGTALGQIRVLADSARRYERFLLDACGPDFELAGMKIVVDCANGAAHEVGPAVLRQLRANVSALGCAPDGININHECGALHPAALQAAVRSQGAALGIALDGDADRVVLVDDRGDVVDGDEILAVLAEAALARNTLGGDIVVGTVMSNMGLEVALRARNLKLLRAAVGDRYVVDEMRRTGAKLGGESSGHIVLLDRHTTGDGLLAALSVCRIMRETQRPLSELRKVMSRFPQALVNVRVAQRRELTTIAAVQGVIVRVEKALDGRGRVLVRFSGTEPLVRVMVEGEDEAAVNAYAAEIAAVVESELKA